LENFDSEERGTVLRRHMGKGVELDNFLGYYSGKVLKRLLLVMRVARGKK
jgi:hypothetical protein